MRCLIGLWILWVWLLSPRPAFGLGFSIGDPLLVGSQLTLNATLSGVTTSYYLQGGLRRQGETNYFGTTLNLQGQPIPYQSSPTPADIQSNFFRAEVTESSWSGQLRLLIDTSSPQYTGPGDYEVRLSRYTGNSSSAAGQSNTLVVTLALPTPTPSPSPTPSLSPTPSPLASPTSLSSPPVSAPSSPPRVSPSVVSPKLVTPPPVVVQLGTEGVVAGVASAAPTPAPSAVTSSAPGDMASWWLGLGMILLGVGISVIWYQTQPKSV